MPMLWDHNAICYLLDLNRNIQCCLLRTASELLLPNTELHKLREKHGRRERRDGAKVETNDTVYRKMETRERDYGTFFTMGLLSLASP